MMIFAIQEINKDQTLLPNIKLGYSIYDNCRKVPQAVRAAFTLLNGIDNSINNSKCVGSPPISAIVGDARSTQSIIIGRIAGRFGIPMVRTVLKMRWYTKNI